MARAHGELLAADVGELVGVPGTTIGQWARRGYISSSQSGGEPRVYSVEDVAEAAMVRELLGRGVPHDQVRRAAARLRSGRRPWPLSRARLAVTRDGPGPARMLVFEAGGWLELGARGWQRVVPTGETEEIALRLALPG